PPGSIVQAFRSSIDRPTTIFWNRPCWFTSCRTPLPPLSHTWPQAASWWSVVTNWWRSGTVSPLVDPAAPPTSSPTPVPGTSRSPCCGPRGPDADRVPSSPSPRHRRVDVHRAQHTVNPTPDIHDQVLRQRLGDDHVQELLSLQLHRQHRTPGHRTGHTRDREIGRAHV